MLTGLGSGTLRPIGGRLAPPSRDITTGLTKTDTGGEVFERIAIALAKLPDRPTCCRAGDPQPTSAIVPTIAVAEPARLGNSPPVSLVRESPDAANIETRSSGQV